MTITLDASNPRTAKSIDLAAHAGQWLRCHTTDGHKAYGIESQANPGLFWLVTQKACSCPDFQYRQEPCKHVLAVRLHVALSKAA